MAKKYFYMFIAFFSTFVIISIFIILFLYNKEKRIISNIIYSYQYNLILTETKCKILNLIQTVIKNEYQNLIKNSKKTQLKLLKEKVLLVEEILKQQNLNVHLKNITLSKKEKCKECFYEKDNKLFYIKYIPQKNIYIKAYAPIKIDTSILIENLKKIDHIILYQNGKKITGDFSNKNFYLFEYFKPLNLFFGIPVEYSKIENLANTINLEIERAVKKAVIGYFSIFIAIIFLFYLLLFTFFKEKIDELNKALSFYQKKAMYDPLTKLLNREGFEEKLKEENKKYFMLIDLDNFKYINDTFGHKIGDKVLKEFAWLLKKYFKEDIIGRWGGDEFLIATNKSKEEIKEIFQEINKKLLQIQKTFDKNIKRKLSVSVGICENPNLAFEERFKNADLALYKVKKSKKGNILFFKDIDYIRIEKEDLK